MADTFKIVGSPVIKDQELPETTSFNGLDQPYLDGYVRGNSGDFLFKSGDTASGVIDIIVGNPVNPVSLIPVRSAFGVNVDLTDSFVAINGMAAAIQTEIESASDNIIIVDIQIGRFVDS